MTRQVSRFDIDDSEIEEGGGGLIPGLPDDVATLCLARVVPFHESCRGVSKRWNSIFRSKRRFSTVRKKLGFRDPHLFILAIDQHTDAIHAKTLNLTTFSWHTVRITPDLYFGKASFRSVSIPSQGLVFVFGGAVCPGSAANVFLKYNARARDNNRWTVIKAMTGEIGFLTAGVVDGKVYVTGLDKKKLSDGEHERVEVLDPEEGSWKPVVTSRFLRRSQQRDFVKATVFDGKLLLTGYDDSTTGMVYDPRADRWEKMAARLSKRLCCNGCAAVEMHGHLFVLAPRDNKSALRVYDTKKDSWDRVQGTNELAGVFSGARLCSWGSKIYVVGDSLGVVVGNVSSDQSGRFQVQWDKVVDAPPKTLVSTMTAQVIIT